MIGYDALGDKEAFTTASIKLQRQKEFYKDFSNTANLRYQHDRHQLLGFDRSISQKSVWAEKRATHEKYKDYLGTKTVKQTVDKVKESGIINKRGAFGLENFVTSNGIKIDGSSVHGVERAIERGVTETGIKDALENPLFIQEVKEDIHGRRSQRFIGEQDTVNVNPDTGVITTVWNTGKATKRKYMKGHD